MTKKRQNMIIKRTALLMLCGLLSCTCIAQQRSKKVAKGIANDFAISKLKENKSDFNLLLSSSQISTNEAVRTGNEAFYIFSSKEGSEFIIVSGDERMPSILAYADKNGFDHENIPPNVRYWLESYVNEYLSLKDENSTNSVTSQSATDNKEIQPLLANNSWGQDSPYNSLCPTVKKQKCVTGCVATAMAQVMNYYKYPSIGQGNISYRTETNNIYVQYQFDEKAFQWDDIANDYSKGYTAEQASAIAELMFACGASVRMDYCTSQQGGSGAYQSDLVPSFIEHFNYDRDAAFVMRDYFTSEDWHYLIVNELNNGRPINYAGTSYRDGGHSFVLDGYYADEEYRYPYYHINWGWDGACNGYYQIADLHPMEDGQYASTSGFSNSHQMLIGVKPEDNMDNHVSVLCVSGFNLSMNVATPGSSIRLNINSCINMSYKTFKGSLHAALISKSDSTEFILGEVRTKNINYLQEQKELNIELNIPADIASGEYIIQLRSTRNQGEEYCKVFSKQSSTLTITSNGNVNQGQQEINDEIVLGASELELIPTEDPSTIKLRIYELINLQNIPFVGYLRMALGDNNGNILTQFGDSILTDELSEQEIQNKPVELKGILSGSWPDGAYKLFVCAKKIHSSRYYHLSYYDITQPNSLNNDLYLDAVVRDGCLYIDGNSYLIPSNSIEAIHRDNYESIETRLSGIQNVFQPNKLFDIIIVEGKKYFIHP